MATCRWIADHRNLLVTGPCGIGKTWLSCALGQKACQHDHTVLYRLKLDGPSMRKLKVKEEEKAA